MALYQLHLSVARRNKGYDWKVKECTAAVESNPNDVLVVQHASQPSQLQFAFNLFAFT